MGGARERGWQRVKFTSSVNRVESTSTKLALPQWMVGESSCFLIGPGLNVERISLGLIRFHSMDLKREEREWGETNGWHEQTNLWKLWSSSYRINARSKMIFRCSLYFIRSDSSWGAPFTNWRCTSGLNVWSSRSSMINLNSFVLIRPDWCRSKRLIDDSARS